MQKINVAGFQGYVGFPDSSVGNESTCNAGDPGSIPGSGRSPGERIGYPLQYFWASLVAQLVKNLPAMRETWVQSLGWGDNFYWYHYYLFIWLCWIFVTVRGLSLVAVKVKLTQLCPTLCDPMDYTVHGILQARILECSLSLLQTIFPTQGSNSGLPHCRRILYQLSHKGS